MHGILHGDGRGLRRLIALFSILISGLLLAACSTGGNAVTAGASVGQGRYIPTSAGGTAGEATLENVYRLRPGDKLKITVFGETDLSGEFEVGVFGAVALPLIGEVKAQGRSIREFRNATTQAFADGYLREPRISVEVVNYRPFYVQGEVRTSGQFDYRSGLTIREAIAMAGGYTYRADQSYILLVREGQGEVRLRTPSDALVLPGDNFNVPERFF